MTLRILKFWNVRFFVFGSLKFWKFEIMKSQNLEILKSWNFEKMKSRRRGPGNDEDSVKQSSKALIWISYQSKTWNEHLVNRTSFPIFKWGNQSLTPLSIPMIFLFVGFPTKYHESRTWNTWMVLNTIPAHSKHLRFTLLSQDGVWKGCLILADGCSLSERAFHKYDGSLNDVVRYYLAKTKASR